MAVEGDERVIAYEKKKMRGKNQMSGGPRE